MNFETITDVERLRGYLAPEPVLAAYQLGDLDPRYLHFCTWMAATEDDSIRALLLLYTGLSVPAVLLLGEGDAVAPLLEHVRDDLPGRFFAQVLLEHEEPVNEVLGTQNYRRMLRMALKREAYQPPSDTDDVVPITHADTAALMRLYQFYPDNFFEPYQLESGLYFGIHDADELVTAAGVHVLSEAHDIVAVGNIVTHPDHRKRGHSIRCTGRLLNAVFERVSLAALNVDESNAAARGTFEKLGFEPHHVFLEGITELR